MTEITKNLRKIRRQQGLSQNDLAERLNITRQAVSNWETGKSFPDLDMIVRLSEVLKTDPNNLLYPTPKDERSKYRIVSFKMVFLTMLVFFVILSFGAGLFGIMFSSLVGGGISESYIYPVYGGIILIAGLIVLCTCIVLEEIRNLSYYKDIEEKE